MKQLRTIAIPMEQSNNDFQANNANHVAIKTVNHSHTHINFNFSVI